MSESKNPRVGFPLRLSASVRARAQLLATRDGISLNHFISLAVAEKISRLEVGMVEEDSPQKRQTAPVSGRSVLPDNRGERRD